MFILPDADLPEIILALETDVVLFPAGMVLRLYINDFTPTKTTILTDLTELTNVLVPGYAAVAMNWNGAPHRKQDGSWEDLASIVPFVAVGGPPPAQQIVYGWYLTNAAGTVLVAAGRFGSPFTFVLDGDGLSLEPVVNVLQVNGTDITVKLDMEIE